MGRNIICLWSDSTIKRAATLCNSMPIRGSEVVLVVREGPLQVPVARAPPTAPKRSTPPSSSKVNTASPHLLPTLHIHYTTHRSPRATDRLPIAASSIQLTNPSSMSERPRRPELGGGAPRAARGAVKSSGMTSSSIHQQHHQQLHHSNFLRSQLTRRPTGAAASGASGASAAGGGSVASGSSAETLREPGGGGVADVDVLSDTSEIVVRNQQGEIELGDPPTPVLEEHDEQAEDRQEAESACYPPLPLLLRREGAWFCAHASEGDDVCGWVLTMDCRGETAFGRRREAPLCQPQLCTRSARR